MKRYIKMRIVKATDDVITIPSSDEITREDKVFYESFDEARDVINNFMRVNQVFPISRLKPGKKYVGISIWDEKGFVEEEVLFRMSKKVVKYFGLKLFTSTGQILHAASKNIQYILGFILGVAVGTALVISRSWFLSLVSYAGSLIFMILLVDGILDEVTS